MVLSIIEPIHIESSRLCCIRFKAKFGLLYIFNVYMPCDNTSPNNFCEYNKVLSIISTYINTHNVVYCFIGGDMNTDIIRTKCYEEKTNTRQRRRFYKRTFENTTK